MSYYNFNDHFWSPKKVCSQSTPLKSNRNPVPQKILLGIVSLVCIAIWTPLILQYLVPGRNNNQTDISLDTNTLGNKCIVFGQERFQIHCSME
ncbi:MAG: hypothetical protein KME32_20200 [Mojavia pulchra JT2-VF2]|jgi:hypothetical protein|uniref:Uncharacterized protein n=1 Tax=Mojavia pulchra JT2-VF2 TaxID=287848 RepID=A0A951Q294_9NOST|nr:hypothetical protein [Mojavia pulchra JT2-VF2]